MSIFRQCFSFSLFCFASIAKRMVCTEMSKSGFNLWNFVIENGLFLFTYFFFVVVAAAVVVIHVLFVSFFLSWTNSFTLTGQRKTHKTHKRNDWNFSKSIGRIVVTIYFDSQNFRALWDVLFVEMAMWMSSSSHLLERWRASYCMLMPLAIFRVSIQCANVAI